MTSRPAFVALTQFKDGREVCLLPSNVFYWVWDQKMNATTVISIHGAILPVRESVEEVTERMNKALGGAVNE